MGLIAIKHHGGKYLEALVELALGDELIIIPVWVPTIIPEYHYPARSPGLFQLLRPVSRKLLSESTSDNNWLLPDGELHPNAS